MHNFFPYTYSYASVTNSKQYYLGIFVLFQSWHYFLFLSFMYFSGFETSAAISYVSI